MLMSFVTGTLHGTLLGGGGVRSRRLRWNGQGAIRNENKILSENLKGTDQSEELGEDGWIIFEWILGK
jgi:hypothetical protein